MALIAFALFEAFKVDVSDPVVSGTAYPTTLLRTIIDVADKIVSHSGQIVLKVTRPVLRRLRFDELWRRCSCRHRSPGWRSRRSEKSK